MRVVTINCEFSLPRLSLAVQPLRKRGRVWSTLHCGFVSACQEFLDIGAALAIRADYLLMEPHVADGW